VIRVLLVDDQAVVREGLKSMLAPESDIRVVGEAANGQQAIAQASRLSPDVVLMDVRMPGMDGLTALEALKRIQPRTSVLMVTLYDDYQYLERAVIAGAAGYILKDASRDEVVRAVRVTAEGGAIIDPSVLPGLLERMSRLATSIASGPADELSHRMEQLTPREIEVLRLVAKGRTNPQIAEELILSPTTVKTHIQNILQKLDVSDRTQAAVLAVRHGLL